MGLSEAIEAFNESGQAQIHVLTTRDGRVVAELPRVGRTVIIEGSQFRKDVKVTANDIAWLCEEVRRALAPGMTLLEVALAALNELDQEDASKSG